MRNVLLTVVVGFCILAIAGCGPREEPAVPAPAEPAAPVPAEPAAPPALEPAPEEPADEAADETAAAEGDTGLAGTTWKMDEYIVEFKDESSVLIKGGQIATLMPDGAMGEYKVEDGKFSVSILGMTLDGSWDGETLIVDDTVAVMQ